VFQGGSDDEEFGRKVKEQWQDRQSKFKAWQESEAAFRLLMDKSDNTNEAKDKAQ